MYKIKYLQTGYCFFLPDEKAEDLKNRFPDEYKILEKNGRKIKDSYKKNKVVENVGKIYEKVVEDKGKR